MIREEVNLTANVEGGKIDINDSAVRDAINSMLDGITNHCFLTPYIALERVSKVLANFHIFLPKYTFMEGDSGLATFPVHQFGEKVGMMDDGRVVTKATTPFTLWFEYQINDGGKYDVFCAIADEDEMKELHADLSDDMNDLAEATLVGPETGPRHKPGADTSSEPGVDMEYEDAIDAHNKSEDIRSLIRSIQARAMKPGLKFAGKEAGSKEKSSSLSESKKKSLDEASAFSSAYKAARKAGQQTFTFRGKSYDSELTKKPDAKQSESKPQNIPLPRERPELTPNQRVKQGFDALPKFTEPKKSESPKPKETGGFNLSTTAYAPLNDPKNKTVQGGQLDAQGKKINTLQDFAKGRSKDVTIAVPQGSKLYGKKGSMDAKDGFTFKQYDPTYKGDAESGTKPGEVTTTIFTPDQKIPVKYTDKFGKPGVKGAPQSNEPRADIPSQSFPNASELTGAAKKTVWTQPYSKKEVKFTTDTSDNNQKMASLDEEDDVTTVPKTSSSQQPMQADREKGLETLKQGMIAKQKETQQRMGDTVDYLKKQEFMNKIIKAPPKKGQQDI